VNAEIRMLCNIQDTYEKSIQNYFQKTYKNTRKVFMYSEDYRRLDVKEKGQEQSSMD